MSDPKNEAELSEGEKRGDALDHQQEAAAAGEDQSAPRDDEDATEAAQSEAEILEIGAEDEDAPRDAMPDPAKTEEHFDASENFAAPAPRGGAGKMLAAGAVTAALGFGGGWFVQKQSSDALSAQIASQAAQISELTGRVQGIEIPDLAPISTRIGALEGALGTQESGLADLGAATEQRFADLRARLAEAELVATGGQADASSAGAYIREVEARLAQLEATASRVTDASDALRAEAAAAQAAAETAMIRANLAEIDIALSSGAPFTIGFTDVGNGLTVPQALRDVAESGVVPIAALREEWPGLARAALAASRADASEEGSNLGSLFAKQFNLRSTQPRAGDDPDAVLSRAEAALTAGDLATALAEIGALPAPAQAAFADWTAHATTTLAAHDAVAALTQQLNEK